MSERRLRAGDWEVTRLAADCFFADQMDEHRAFSVHRSFASEDEVQTFLRDEQLGQIGERTHGTWPVRQYRQKGQ